MSTRLHVFSAGLGPFHRPIARFPRSQRTHSHVRVIRNLDPEAASNVETLHEDLIDSNAQRWRKELRRKSWKRIVRPILDALGPRIPNRDHRVAFERRARESMEV